MIRRRDLFKAAGIPGVASGIAPQPLPVKFLKRARDVIRSGVLGPVPFCRVGHRNWLPAASFVLEELPYVPELDPRTDGLVFLGRDATLAVGREGVRVFARESAQGESTN